MNEPGLPATSNVPAARAATALQVVLLCSVVAAVVAVFLPLRGGVDPVAPWAGFGPATVPVAWPGFLQAAVVAVGALALAAVGAIRALRSSAVPAEGDGATTWLVAVAALAAAALQLRQWADPLPFAPPTAPLREHMAGLSAPLWSAIAIGGLFALVARPASLVGRGLAAAGALGLALLHLQPVGWIGRSLVPAVAALTGFDPAHTGGPPVAHLAGATAALLSTALALGVLAYLALPRLHRRPLALVAGLALAFPVVAWPLRAGIDTGGSALHVAGCVGAVACSLALLAGWRRGGFWRAVSPRAEWVAVGVIVASYAVLKVNGLRYSTTDESLYFLAARQWANGLVPYRDFFFSHPPLHIAVPAGLYAVFGFHFLIGKVLSAAAALGAAVAVWRIARRWLGIWPGVATLALDLFAAEVLLASTNLTGVNLTACWMAWGLWAALSGRFFLAGLLLGGAASTGFYAIGMLLTLGGLALLAPLPAAKRAGESLVSRLARHPAVLLGVGFLAVWGSLAGFFWVLAGDAYVDAVYAYHFAKKAKVEGFVALDEGPHAIVANFFTMLASRDFAVTLYHHAALFWLALWAPVAALVLRQLGRWAPAPRAGTLPEPWWRFAVNVRAWWREPDRGGALLIAWVCVGALVVEFAQFKERYDFYWALVLPVVCVAAAGSLAALGTCVLAAVHALPPPGTPPIQLPPVDPAAQAPTLRLVAWTSVALVAVLLWVPISMAANHTAYPSEFDPGAGEVGPGEVLRFDWTSPPGPPWLADVTQAVFWQDFRVRGSLESGVHHYLWSKKRWFSTADEIARYLAAHLAPDETVTGASDYTPLLALLANRRMAGNQVDTNSKVFSTGAVSREAFWDRACADKLKAIVVAPQSYFAPQTIGQRATAAKHFQRAALFQDPLLKHWKALDIEVWLRRSQAPCRYEGRRGGDRSLDD